MRSTCETKCSTNLCPDGIIIWEGVPGSNVFYAVCGNSLLKLCLSNRSKASPHTVRLCECRALHESFPVPYTSRKFPVPYGIAECSGGIGEGSSLG